MSPEHSQALAELVGRPLTAEEVSAIDPYVSNPDDRNDVEIARVLSAGRTKPQPMEIGTGTILLTLGDSGGAFLDALVVIGETNRNVFWTMDLIRQGRLRIDLPGVRAQMQALAEATAQSVPAVAEGLGVLLTLGLAPDPLPVDAVSRALNIAEGRMVM
jgi:hypothetical protein